MRYFIVSYLFGNGSFGSGIIGIKSKTYPSIQTIKKEADINNLTPICINEVNEKDYNEFWKKD